MEYRCLDCDYQSESVGFIIKPLKVMGGHKNLPHCPKCGSAMIKRVKRISGLTDSSKERGDKR